MGKYTITQAQWRFVAQLPQINQELDPDPCYHKGDNLPVVSVTWYDAIEFCDRLSQYTGKTYFLPSEAEWEYACRAGTTTPYHFGETITPDMANYNAKEITPVGSFGVASAFGLYDMHGNVWEWCLDDWHYEYKYAPTDGGLWLFKDSPQEDTEDNITLDFCLKATVRSGAYGCSPESCYSTSRTYTNRDERDYINDTSFRVVCYEGQILKQTGSESTTITKLPNGNKSLKIAQIPQELPTYSFEVVTVNRKGEIIKKGWQQARHFSESLGKGIGLEIDLDMVYIPEGTFIMGSPEDEKGSRDNEKPQHQVTVQQFYMGKYPITQAQWQAVANLPKIQREFFSYPYKLTRFADQKRSIYLRSNCSFF
jgi:formylglycine-generating enzyme required for sulfatase activity